MLYSLVSLLLFRLGVVCLLAAILVSYYLVILSYSSILLMYVH
jgi:hypothetical protein